MKNQYNLISFLLFLFCVGASVIENFVGSSTVLSIIYYIALVLGIMFLALDSFKQKNFAPVFIFKNRFHLNVFAIVVSVGLFVDFVCGVVKAYQTLFDSSYISIPPFVALCISVFMALLSSFYYVLVSSSFGGSNYDFRKMRVLHFAPLLWAISKAFSVLDEVPSILQDDASILKYVVLLLLCCAFFFFAFEVDSTDGARKGTVFSFRAMYYTGIIYSINDLILLLGGAEGQSVFDHLFALTALTICGFMYFCEKNIVYHTRLEV